MVHSGFGDYGAFTGSPIDTASYALFEPFYRELAFGHEDSELFATLQVPLGSGRVAYLLRVPGMYEPSAIDLWVYDAHRGRFELPIQLAEVWGDAGESFEVQSWLVTPKGDGTLDVVLRKVTDYKRIVVDTLTDSATLIPVSHSDSLWFVTCGPSGTIKRLLPANSPLAGIFDPEKWSRGPR